MTPIPVEQALTLLLQAIHPIEAVERLPLGLACGRISAHTVLARLPQPPFNRSAMDGYALCSTDLTEELTLSLQSPTEALLPGHAMPITTGGLMPEGADCMIQQEAVTVTAGKGQLRFAPKAGQNVCQCGGEMAAGTCLLKAGEHIIPAHIGLLAADGAAEIMVRHSPRVAVISIGDELRQPGEPLGKNEVYDCNGPMLTARLGCLNFVTEYHLCRDEMSKLRQVIDNALKSCDAVVTIGGGAVGSTDLMPELLSQMAEPLLFDHVIMKPGGHMAAGLTGGKPIFSLSGNPFAAVATFELLCLPALLRLAGLEQCIPRRATLRLRGSFSKANKRRRFLRAMAQGDTVTLPVCSHASGSLYGLAGCNCMIDVPENCPALTDDEMVEVVYFA